VSRRLVWAPRALRDLDRVDRQGAARAVTATERYAATEHGSVKLLTGIRPPLFSLRIGRYRVLFRLGADDTLNVLRVLHRREAYR
jgi:mRNA-degrading endonuclease RelE of RelBE toxin-antitoxin system